MNRIGKKYGRLLVQSRASSGHDKDVWKCICICGNKVRVRDSSLPRVRSCGCRRRGPVPLPLELRFWTKIDTRNRPEPTTCHGFGLCLLWRGEAKAGRPYMEVGGKYKLAYHVAWFLAYGVWPKFLCHRCDNPRCVAIAHLSEGDHAANQYDRRTKALGGIMVP